METGFTDESQPGGRRYFELSGGYSRAWNGYNGWNAAFVGKPRSWIGVAGDFSGYYRDRGVAVKQNDG